MPLDNFGRVGPRVYRSAQYDADGLETLRTLGVTIAIKLNTRDEALEPTAWGVVTVSFPFGLVAPPDEATRKIVDQIATYVREGETVVIHCTHGRDRTGFICAAYQMLALKMPLDKVLKERARYGVDDPWHRLFNESFTHALERLQA